MSQEKVISDALDSQLVAAYNEKTALGEKPNKQQKAAYRRYLKRTEDGDRWLYYASIPKRHWVALSGRGHAVLKHHAGRFGIPVQAEVIDLRAVASWIHDFLAKNCVKLSGDIEDPLLVGGGNSPNLEAYRLEKAKLARLDRLEREGAVVAVGVSNACWLQAGVVFHQLGEQLQQRYGVAAQRMLNQAIQDAERAMQAVFAPGGPAQVWDSRFLPPIGNGRMKGDQDEEKAET